MASGASSPVEIVNWYNIILTKFISFLSPSLPMEVVHEKAEFWFPVFASASAVILLIVIAFVSGFARLKPETMTDAQLLPPKRFGLFAFVELSWSVVFSTLESTLGEKNWARFAPVLGGTFFLLIITNLSGVFPGFEPATATMSFTFAAAMTIFIYFNYYGFKESGFAYVKHLAGPVIWIAPLMFVIELVSVFARPVSLSLRIFGNVTGDHFVFKIFSGLMRDIYVPFVPIPAVFLAFGTFVACVQAFIFMTLSAVYIKLALDSKESH
ncbi:MAG: F0F1 ATP synthase subunit A [Bdellovibrionota bacterium]